MLYLLTSGPAHTTLLSSNDSDKQEFSYGSQSLCSGNINLDADMQFTGNISGIYFSQQAVYPNKKIITHVHIYTVK